MSKTMKALVKAKAEKGLWLQEVPIPEIAPNEVLIKIERTAICGTDMHIYGWDEWAQKNVPVPLVVGHEYGGTNPTMLKAMAYGSAILALDTVFNREMLQDGQYGLFFDKNSKSVSEIVNNAENGDVQIEKLKENSREGLGQRYDWDVVTEQYLSVFEKLLGNSPDSNE